MTTRSKQPSRTLARRKRSILWGGIAALLVAQLANAQPAKRPRRPPTTPPTPAEQPVQVPSPDQVPQQAPQPPEPTPVPPPVPPPVPLPSPQPTAPDLQGLVPDEQQPGDQAVIPLDEKKFSPKTKISFNLENADLPELVRLMSDVTGKRFLLPTRMRQISATILAPTDVTAAEAYNAFLSILAANGMTIVPAGRYLKIIDSAGIEASGSPVYGDGQVVPGIDRFITQLYYVQNVPADDAANLLTKFKSKDGAISSYPATNLLVITDTGMQIQRLMKLMRAIDVARTGVQTWIEQIHYAQATDLAERLKSIFSPSASSGTPSSPPNPERNFGGAGSQSAGGGSRAADASTANIIADERTNSLIIVSSERAYLRILEMIRRLDIPLEGDGRVHVHYVQHSAAKDIAAALTSMFGLSSQPAAGGGAPGGKRPEASGGLFEGDVRVVAYEPANALVITSSAHDFAAMRNVIDRLDAPRKQVFIEAVIMELSVKRSNELGLGYHGGAKDVPTSGSLAVFGFNAGNSINPFTPESLTGLALGVRGPEIADSKDLVGVSVPGFGVALTAIAGSGDANILATPHLIALDNVEAEINVGANIPLQQSGIPAGLLTGANVLSPASASGTAAANTAASLAQTSVGNVPRQDVGTKIKITPHINNKNEIRLEIEEEISEKGATEGTLQVVSIDRRTAKTEVMAQDQQTIVIGGLMRDKIFNSETKVPVLGDIPLIGSLFRKTKREKEKTNLLLFLTPYVIRDASDLRAIYERKMRERQEFIDRNFVFSGADYAPPIDYSRTRGLIAEIMNEIHQIDIEILTIEEAKNKKIPVHVPQEPVGIARPVPPVAVQVPTSATPAPSAAPATDAPVPTNQNVKPATSGAIPNAAFNPGEPPPVAIENKGTDVTTETITVPVPPLPPTSNGTAPENPGTNP